MAVFYYPEIEVDTITLSAEESRHCVKSLRKKEGDIVLITDGKGVLAHAEIMAASISDCVIHIVRREKVARRRFPLHIAVAPTKNSDRMEWFVEKAVEIGIEQISFIICEHSERCKIDLNRLQRIAVSALKQSQTTYLPEMEILDFSEFMTKYDNSNSCKLMAWCDDQNTAQLADCSFTSDGVIILVGPEGDFSREEIEYAKRLNYKEIKLGNRRLRTETAALYSCCIVAAQNL